MAHSAAYLPKHANVPGGVLVIPLDIESTTPPLVHYQKVRTMVMPNPKNTQRWFAIVGIPLDAK